jgi:hypothetical protein
MFFFVARRGVYLKCLIYATSVYYTAELQQHVENSCETTGAKSGIFERVQQSMRQCGQDAWR